VKSEKPLEANHLQTGIKEKYWSSDLKYNKPQNEFKEESKH
jgi:hypothetical protein